ncbi:unnamed protein product [Gadus morhua 'NCC']
MSVLRETRECYTEKWQRQRTDQPQEKRIYHYRLNGLCQFSNRNISQEGSSLSLSLSLFQRFSFLVVALWNRKSCRHTLAIEEAEHRDQLKGVLWWSEHDLDDCLLVRQV